MKVRPPGGPSRVFGPDVIGLVAELLDPQPVERDLETHPQLAAVVHHDALDEVQHDLTPQAEGQLGEAIAEGRTEAVEGGEVPLEGGGVVVVLPQDAGLGLGLLSLGPQLLGLGLADGRVEAGADGGEVVVDLAVDAGEPSLDGVGLLAVLAAPGLDAAAQPPLEVRPGVLLAQARLDEVEHEALDPVGVDGQRRADRAAPVEVAGAVVRALGDLVAAAGGVGVAPADEVVAAVLTADDARQQVLHRLALAGVQLEPALRGELLAFVPQLPVDEGGVGVAVDDALVVGCGTTPGAAGLAALQPHDVAGLDGVVEDVVD